MYTLNDSKDGGNTRWHRLAGWAGRVGLRALDLVLPPRCLSCGVDVDRTGALCPRCWTQMRFIAPPQCDCCGTPFDFVVEGRVLCGACSARAPRFARCRSVLIYDEASRGLILRFKHADRTDAAPALAAWMARAGGELLEGADLIVPVPLHRWRLFRRRYNQAALLALALGRLSGRSVMPDLLVRRRAGTQGGQSAKGRVRTVAGAFTLPSAHRPLVAGRRVLLVDDVLTTGATVEECARTLLRAGAVAVDVLTVARVARARQLE